MYLIRVKRTLAFNAHQPLNSSEIMCFDAVVVLRIYFICINIECHPVENRTYANSFAIFPLDVCNGRS
jgi:hypothetical protein